MIYATLKTQLYRPRVLFFTEFGVGRVARRAAIAQSNARESSLNAIISD